MNIEYTNVEKSVREIMNSHSTAPAAVEDFLKKIKKVSEGHTGIISWDEISDLEKDDLIEIDSSAGATDEADYSKLVVIKLNGGLGTSMGLSRAKSVIPVKANLNFLEIIMNQIHLLRKKSKSCIPVLFMNSYNTSKDTLSVPGMKELNDCFHRNFPEEFLQNRVLRLEQRSLLPAGNGDDDDDWCPPGHGDIYLSLLISGMLEELLNEGYTTAFISNVDNLGATVSGRILSDFNQNHFEFAMEITPKTAADVKGGVLVRRNGRIELLEIAQVDRKHQEDFQDIKRFGYFNTNNIWINLEALRDKLKSGLDLSLILNPKTVKGKHIIQIETAMGSAIGCFHKTAAFVVPRDRFAPVKNCADLLVRRSDAYILENQEGSLIPNPSKDSNEIIVRLSDDYKNLEDFDRLFNQIPSLLKACAFEVQGAVHFDIPVEIQGSVSIKNSSNNVHRISELGRTVIADENICF